MAVDISSKPVSIREAVAEGYLYLKSETLQKIMNRKVAKGDIYESARLAAIHGVKQTPTMLILTHPIPILNVKTNITVMDESSALRLEVGVKTEAKTGCEMEALAGVVNGLLMVWDMVKQYEKDPDGQYPTTSIKDIRVLSKVKHLP